MGRFDEVAVGDAVKTYRSVNMASPSRNIIGTVVAVTKTTFDVKWPDGFVKKYLKSNGIQYASSGYLRSRVGVIGYADYMEDESALLRQDAERFSKAVQLRAAMDALSEKLKRGRLPVGLFSDESAAKSIEAAMVAVQDLLKALEG